LTNYLSNEEDKIRDDMFIDDDIRLFAASFNKYIDSQKTTDRESINKILSKKTGAKEFVVLNFNYTNVFEKINIACNRLKKEKIFGTRYFNGLNYENDWIKIEHPHGDISGNIIFGVDNDEQIGEINIFNNCHMALKNQLIKNEMDALIGENIDKNAFRELKQSSLIYLYGLSIGETDTTWWKRIIDLMYGSDLILIIHSHKMMVNKIKSPAKRKIEKDKIINEFMKYSEYKEADNEVIKSRIYIDDTDIFSDFAEIVRKKINNKTNNKTPLF
ncbi:MAG: hypothetical protein J6P57_08895, partial [Lachnospiraceae bacterium]|nr:hypothetical protein [Lachnospiraceae bacterium]